MAQEVMQKTGTSSPAPTSEATRDRPLYRPLTDIVETEESVIVTAEMPGVGPDDVDITLENRVLTIRGRTPTNEHAGYRRVYTEYGDGDYERSFTLSEDIDRNRIKAEQKNGVLVLELPKAKEAQPKKIKVKAG